MNRVLPFLIILIFSVLHGNAQQSTFGEVSLEDFNVTFPGEEDAPAIIIQDIGKSVFVESQSGFQIEFTRTVRLKINSKEGLDYGEGSVIAYQDGYNRTEMVSDIEGYTYYIEEGLVKKKSLEKEAIFEEDLSDKLKRINFALPVVRENTIVEYRYKLTTPFKVNLPDWEFQRSIPTLYSSYQVALNPFYEYSFRLQGAGRFDQQSSEMGKGTKRFASIEYNDMIHTYVMENIGSFRDETFITSRDDYIVKLDFQLAKINFPTGGSREIMTTWERLNDALLKDYDGFGKFLNQSGKEARDILDEMPADADKLKWIVEYVRANYSWNGYYSRMAIEKAKDFASTRSGYSGEINLFLCAMLQEAGFDAKPVLISTRSHGKVRTNYPFQDQFNNVIVMVTTADGLILTDGTEQHIPYNTIPPDCINGEGLIVDKDGGQFVSLVGFNNSQLTVNLIMEPDPAKETITSGVLYQARGYEAYRVRKQIDQDLDYYKQVAEDYGIKGISAFETEAGEDSKFTMRYEGHSELEKLGDNLIISPFLDYPLSENPLKNRERRLPVDLTYSKREVYSSQIKLPEGYQLEDIPASYSVDDGLMKIDYSCQKLGEFIVTSGEVVYKKSVYSNREYARLRAHFMKMVELLNQQLIFVKKGT